MADVHCSHVLFGASADNGYARLLGQYSANDDLAKRITLLKGPPFAPELAVLSPKFKTESFSSVFRVTKLPNRYAPFSTTLPPQTRTPAATNYASAAAKAPPSPPPETKSTPSDLKKAQKPKAAFNSAGERVDLPISVSQREVSALKQRKMCNYWHLTGDCYSPDCPHEHGTRLTGKDLDTLRYIARLTPCVTLRCVDEDCFYGHTTQMNLEHSFTHSPTLSSAQLESNRSRFEFVDRVWASRSSTKR
jgi:hypothetical protein